MITNEFERDLNDTSFLKRPGRVDLRVLQNSADVGDGHPGLQRCFRNYLHEGGMEKDLELIGFGIKGTSVDINNAEMQQLSNIGTTTISGAQWVFVGEADQAVKIADSPTFGGITVNGNIIITGNVDGVDVGDLKSNYDIHKGSTGADHSYLDQSVVQASSPTFVGLTLSANLVTSSTVDGVDVGSHVHSGAGQGGTVDHVNLSSKGTKTHTEIDTHIGSTGIDHSYINQDVKSSANVTFANLNMGFGGLIKGSLSLYLETVAVDGAKITISDSDIMIYPDDKSSSFLFILNVDNNDDCIIYQSGATVNDERGTIGTGTAGEQKPFKKIMSYEFYADESGNYKVYDFVDDLQLLREIHNSEESRKPIIKDSKQTITSFDLRSLPWVKSVPEAKDMKDEDLKYAFNNGHATGYLLSTIKKLLERQDKLISELNGLGINVKF